jgi:hypothetical protein
MHLPITDEGSAATAWFYAACDQRTRASAMRRECAVIEIDAETLEVELPHELHAEQARLELDLYLRVWQSLHDWPAVEHVEKL